MKIRTIKLDNDERKIEFSRNIERLSDWDKVVLNDTWRCKIGIN